MECFCDYDPPSVCSKKVRTARKEHKCEECRCIIQPGEKYEYVWGVWEGCPEQFKACSRCVALRVWVMAHVPCFCWAYGTMIDDARETIDQFRHECDGLWFGFLRRLYVIDRLKSSQLERRPT